MLSVSTDNLRVVCVCGEENNLVLDGEINSELAVTCKKCGRGILITVAVVVENMGALWLN